MIYLDHAATTPVRPEVLEAMLPYFTEHFGNPSSVHRVGLSASEGVLRARRTLAELVGIPTSGVVFTAGGTEADVLANVVGGQCDGAVSANLGHSHIAAGVDVGDRPQFTVADGVSAAGI